jgi:hypothetical protein
LEVARAYARAHPFVKALAPLVSKLAPLMSGPKGVTAHVRRRGAVLIIALV